MVLGFWTFPSLPPFFFTFSPFFVPPIFFLSSLSSPFFTFIPLLSFPCKINLSFCYQMFTVSPSRQIQNESVLMKKHTVKLYMSSQCQACHHCYPVPTFTPTDPCLVTPALTQSPSSHQITPAHAQPPSSHQITPARAQLPSSHQVTQYIPSHTNSHPATQFQITHPSHKCSTFALTFQGHISLSWTSRHLQLNHLQTVAYMVAARDFPPPLSLSPKLLHYPNHI